MLNPSPKPSSCTQLCFLLAVIKNVPQVTTGDPVATWRNQAVSAFVPFLPAVGSLLPGAPGCLCPPEAPSVTSPCPAGTYGIQGGAMLLSLKCFGKGIIWEIRKVQYENGFYYCSTQSNNPWCSLMQICLKTYTLFWRKAPRFSERNELKSLASAKQSVGKHLETPSELWQCTLLTGSCARLGAGGRVGHSPHKIISSPL